MKQVKLLLLALCLTLLSPANMRGAEVQGYQVDFEKEITTSAHDFKVASNWKHIVHKYNDGYSDHYMNYSYKPTDGVNGTGALLASEQRAGDNWDYEYTHDLLVTPKVSGEIKIKVKANHSSKGYIEFYKLNETETQDSGAAIASYKASTGDINTTDYTEVSCTVDDMQRIGIRASYVYLDDFWAETADIEPEKSIRILTAEPSQTSGAIYWDQQPDKSVLVKFTNVTVENNGEVDLTQGEKNFSISLINGNTNASLGKPVNVPQNLKIGTTSEPFDVSISIPAEEVTGLWSYSGASAKIYLKENLQGSIVQRAYSYYNAYESKFCFQTSESTSSSSIQNPIDFGMVNEATTQEFKIKNDGAAPLEIVSVSLPTGYTSTLAADAQTVPAHSQIDFTISMTADLGAHNGDLVIVYKDNDGTDKEYKIALNGYILGENTWYTKFQDGGKLAYPLGSIAEGGIRSNSRYVNGSYDYYLYSYTNTDYQDANNKFITPLLHAEAGDVLTFDVARDANGSNYNLKVYVSTDRVNWGEPLATIGYDDLTGTAFVTRSIEIAQKGDYYVGFAVYGMKLDNIIGLQKVDVAHDIYFTKITQDEATQSGKNFNSSATIIAPIGLTSADYTVKYYINGEAVKEISSKTVTADAKKTNDFSTGTLTPTADKTTVYETYYEFAFTDGTVIKSPVKELKVTNEPWFVFIKAGTTVNFDHQATNYNSKIDFGTVNTTGLVQNFEILNWGTAPLTVKSITVPEGFSVNIAEATVQGKERQTVDVTFSAETPGNYSGKLTVVYVDANGEDATFSLDVSGTMLDPAKWYAPFESGTTSTTSMWPVGSLYQSGLSLSQNSGTYALYGSSMKAENAMFITPLLHAEAGETVSFKACIYNLSWKEGIVEVYAAKTRADLENAENRIELGKWSGENVDDEHLLNDDFSNIEITIAEAGDYYLGFVLYNRAYVDDIYGLELVPVVHDVVISASEVSPTGMQNKDAAASITLLNIGINPEAAASYTVAAYVNGVKSDEFVGTELPTVNSLNATGVKSELSFRSPKAGTFPVYLEVNFGDGYVLTTEPVDVTFEEETISADVTVGTPNGFESGIGLNLTYHNSESVTLYTPAELGLGGGEKIRSIVIRGYGSVEWKTALKVAYEWTDDQTQSSPNVTEYDASGMTECLNIPEYAWPTTGSAAEPVDMITVTFDEPITYESGKSLRLLIKSTSTGWKSGFNFEKSKTTGHSYLHYKDGALANDWSSKNSPVLHISLAVEPRTYAPTVVDGEGNAVAGATVTLISNDGDNVQYEGTTGEDGKCSINVIQSGRTYDVEVKSEAGEAYLDGVSVEEASFEGDIVLLPVVNITDESVHTEGKDAAVVYLNTVFEPGFNAVALPFALDATEVAELFGEDCTVMEFASETRTGNEVKAHFETVKTGMEAGKPYLVYLTGSTAPAMYKNKAVATQLQTVAKTELSFVPATEPTALGAGMYLLTEDNYEHTSVNRANAIETVKPYRAYMRVSDPNVTAVSFDNSDDIQTGIEDIEADAFGEDDVIYNLQGIRVTNPVKGNIYIVNGKTVVIK